MLRRLLQSWRKLKTSELPELVDDDSDIEEFVRTLEEFQEEG
jgi:hypothetical protein